MANTVCRESIVNRKTGGGNDRVGRDCIKTRAIGSGLS